MGFFRNNRCVVFWRFHISFRTRCLSLVTSSTEGVSSLQLLWCRSMADIEDPGPTVAPLPSGFWGKGWRVGDVLCNWCCLWFKWPVRLVVFCYFLSLNVLFFIHCEYIFFVFYESMITVAEFKSLYFNFHIWVVSGPIFMHGLEFSCFLFWIILNRIFDIVNGTL